MTAFVEPDEEECFLLALMDDPSGIDLAEFLWVDEGTEDGCFRLWPFQWWWYQCEDRFQIDQAGRSLGKSVGIAMRAFAFAFVYPGQEMLITAPELNHLRPVCDNVEKYLLGTRLGREMVNQGKQGNGISRQPHWQCRFRNGARIFSRIPNNDGRGVLGMHPLVLEADEMQNYPLAGWTELVETLNRGQRGAQWRAHGVSRGVRDKYYEITTNGQDSREPKDSDVQWTVHRKVAMMRPSWSPEERAEKIDIYGGTEDAPDYRRNIYGEHGDATNPLFVLNRLMQTVATGDRDGLKSWDDEYNNTVYQLIKINDDIVRKADCPISTFIDLPQSHLTGYKGYWVGQDVGFTIDPTEILVFGWVEKPLPGHGEHAKDELLRLLTRIQLRRISADQQAEVAAAVFRHYGPKLRRWSMDKTGNGLPLFQIIQSRYPDLASRIQGYHFWNKVAVHLEDRELKAKETIKDLAIEQNIVEYASDQLRAYVDTRRLELPYDREVLTEWMGQTVGVVKDMGNPYGTRRSYSYGTFHTLDAGKMFIAGKTLETIENTLNATPVREDIRVAFL